MSGRRPLHKRSQRTPVRATPHRFVTWIQDALSLDLLHRDYAPSTAQRRHACLGHCYVATEAAYHLFGKKRGYAPFTRTNPDGTTHWWLEHTETGDIIDPSKPQLGGRRYPYEEGRRQAFLTKRPSRRAQELIRRVRARTKR